MTLAGERPMRPPPFRKVHVIAACGTGTGALALLLRQSGVRVTGSDTQAYPPMGDLLRAAGVEVRIGFAPENIPSDADFVVIGNAVSRDNIEVQETLKRGIPYGSFPETVSRCFLADRRPIVVAGTHGKTTSTALLAWLLESAGMGPGFLVGGEPRNFGASSRLGRGDWFVIEGDEYDSAFFDKGPKFLHYRPRMALLTSLEYDHADIYESLEALETQFRRFVRILPEDGCLAVCAEYPGALEVAREARCPVWTYGFGTDADWRGVIRERDGKGTEMEVLEAGERVGIFRFPLSGTHNALNVLGSVGLLRRAGVSPELLQEGLQGFAGVRRRQEELGEVNGVLLVDDFAHHPTAVRETLRGLRARYPGRRIIAVFEPRSHTSRRKVFQQAYAEACSEADVALCAKVYRAESVDEPDRFDPVRWASELAARGTPARYIEASGELVDELGRLCEKGDVVLFMSSGSLEPLIENVKRRLEGATQ